MQHIYVTNGEAPYIVIQSRCPQHLASVNTAEYHPDEDPAGAEARDHQVQDVIHLLLLGDNGCLTGCRLGLDDDHVGT